MAPNNSPLRKINDFFNGIEADSISGKIILNFIDKIIIGLLALLIVSLAQHHYEKNKKIKEMAFELTKIQTEFIVTYRKMLSKSINGFIGLVISSDAIETGNIEDKDMQDLNNMLKEIKISIFNLQAYNNQLNDQGESVIQAASALFMDVTSGSSTKEVIEKDLKVLRTSYSVILNGIKRTTRVVLRKEYSEEDDEM